MSALVNFTDSKEMTTVARNLLEMPQVPCNVRHIFYPGVYMRELHLPAGAFCIGLRARQETLNVMVKGRARILNEDGTASEIAAPMMFYAKPGSRKAGIILEDVVWLNVYDTDERDVETLEETYFHMDEVPRSLALPCPGEYPFSAYVAAQIRSESERDDDLTPFPNGPYKVKVGRSTIEGKGLIATADIAAGEVICIARLAGKRTPAGRYTNHASIPNAHFVEQDGDVYMLAIRDISGCAGGLDGEEITVDYRCTPRYMESQQ